jgi:hypothetical protein
MRPTSGWARPSDVVQRSSTRDSLATGTERAGTVFEPDVAQAPI